VCAKNITITKKILQALFTENSLVSSAFFAVKCSMLREGTPPPLNARIREIRETLRLSQVQFARVISLSPGYLAGMELGDRKVNDRFVKLVCSSFNINENWLRDGKGEMFLENRDEEFTRLAALYRDLTPQYKKYVLKQIELLLDMQDEKAG
jgi:transcriptional regulator with XRE-family HTH domain